MLTTVLTSVIVLGATDVAPVPIINPTFDDDVTAWVTEGGLAMETARIESPDGTPDTSTGMCLALGPGQGVRTRGPMVQSLPKGTTLDINLSLRERDAAGGRLDVQLVNLAGEVLASESLDPGDSWSRQRVSIAGGERTSSSAWLRLQRTGDAGLVLVDNIALERVGGPEAGFVSLFDGETLSGWIRDTEGYEVVDGAIQCKPGSGGDLRTVGQYGDFILRFEFRLAPGGNNGIAVRAPIEGNAAYEGMEIQVIDSMAPGYADLKPWQHHGSAYGLVAAERGWMLPPGTWNREEIRLQGSRLTVVLNGHIILDADINAVLEAGTASGSAHEGARRTSGHLGFCGHGTAAAFRNLRVMPLVTSRPAP
ncbi:MAG: DUF1080 domain-containing protein [Phycisphaerales bacterium]|nr:DUF1080 domain-containing protein [Phycisphaerales bacterium]